MEGFRNDPEEAPECAVSENSPIRQDLTPMLTERGTHPEFHRRGLSPETCEALGIGWLGVGRSILKNHVVFQMRGAARTQDGLRQTVLSHVGYKPETDPPWRFYQAFTPELELYGQDILALDPAAQAQAQETGSLLLVADPFEFAKVYQAGLRNAAAPFGQGAAPQQIDKLSRFAQAFGVAHVKLLFPRSGGAHARAMLTELALKQAGLTSERLAWNKPVGQTTDRGPILIPPAIQSLADMTREQILWLRSKGLI